MKGISAIIAVVLILMITVALAAMAYVWFTGVFKTISESAGESATKAGQDIATQFSIAGATNSSDGRNIDVYVTNTGSSDIEAKNFLLLVNGVKRNHVATEILAPGETATLTNTTTVDKTYTCDNSVKITYGSLEQVTTIQC
ncbi:MAG: hypothetical protein PHU12_01890 [Candidatus Aenigmarchaeota archaeon]|nr:hypothetical protein [Candidatus Aenigmarchaeota archaeon]